MPRRRDHNRESWLTELSQMMLPLYQGFQMHPFRLTCGWPVSGGVRRRGQVIGECHAKEASKSGHHEIFINPMLDDPLQVAGVTAHEIAHVAAGIPAGHKGEFVRVCKHVGITKGKPTNAMPNDKLNERLSRFIEKLGEYPHSALKGIPKPVKPKSSVTLLCPQCECRVTMTTKWFNDAGIPTCGCGVKMLLPE